jgi:ParB family chromosome partitioning protein
VTAKFGLGKGLDALLASGDDAPPPAPAAAPAPRSGELKLPLDQIKANPNQPRRTFEPEALEELAASIREHGVIQPIVVEADPAGGYVIVAGERRTRAARIAGLTEVPAVLRDYSAERRLEVALIENVQREDLNPIEEAAAYKALMELTELSQEETAARVGKKRSTVANALRLLKLPDDMRDSLADGRLSPGHARAILSVVNPADQRMLFERLLEEGSSVREAEKYAGELNAGSRAAAPKSAKPETAPKAKDPDLLAIEQKFIDVLGTKVAISGGLKSGSIRIDYYSADDLDRVYAILAGGK